MARGRLISKSLGSSRLFHALLHAGGKLGEFCQVLFPLIIANTDDFGRMPADAFTVKNVVLPSSRRPERDFDRALDVLAEVGLIDRYEVLGNGSKGIFLQVVRFDEHQANLHKRTMSRYPESPGSSGKYRHNLRELNLTEENLTEEKRTEENPEPRLSAHCDESLFDQFWTAYPKKKAKDDARRAWDRRRPDKILLSTILVAIEAQRRSPEWLKDGGQFIPYPATWLNQARWMDESTAAPAPDVIHTTNTRIAGLIAGGQAFLNRRHE